MTVRRDLPLRPAWRGRLHEVIFEADTAAGRTFDVLLLWCIVLSVVAVLLESVASVHEGYAWFLRAAEWAFTILFTVEYVMRLVCIGRPLRYASSFFGVVDLLAIVPTYLSVLLPGAQTLLVIRALRLLRVFRVLKLVRFVEEARVLGQALRASRHKITVFLGTVLTTVLIVGTLMYLVEGEATARQAAYITLWTDTRFEAAHAFYKAHGFRQTGRRELDDASQSVEYGFRKEL